MEDEKSLEQRR